jgi:hypothetical protein
MISDHIQWVVHLLVAVFGVTHSQSPGGYTYEQPSVSITARGNVSTYTNQVRLTVSCFIRRCIQKFPDSIYNEIYAFNNKHSLRRNTKGYGGKTH